MTVDMLKNIIKNNVKEFMFDNFQHIIYPDCLYAKVTKFEENIPYNKVNLKILDSNKIEDENYQELPNILTDLPLEKNDIVILNFVNGELESPVIIRKVVEKNERH